MLSEAGGSISSLACRLVPTRADRCTYVCYEGTWQEPIDDDQPNSAGTAAEIEAGSSHEEEADFCYFLKILLFEGSVSYLRPYGGKV